jgi:phosphoglycolate phosphatase-like HAD superfamily hydrolase
MMLAIFLVATARATNADPLPSWNEGATKAALLGFVRRSVEAGPGFVEPKQRIATFDNDGTLWSEQPVYFQLAFAVDRVVALAPRHPEWKTKEPFRSLLRGDVHAALAGGQKAAVEILAATHAGMTTDEFADIVSQWVLTARHPRTGRLYTEMVYQPMLELLALLRQNHFTPYIVSGGGIEFLRVWAERVYGIPPEHVVGSSGATTFTLRPSGPVLLKGPEVAFVDDGPGKPVAIQRVIGRRPLLAFGNSDGDLQMLEWTAARRGPHLMGVVHHTDAAREWAYDRGSPVGKLEEALRMALSKGWLVVDMKRDWQRIYPFEPPPVK